MMQMTARHLWLRQSSTNRWRRFRFGDCNKKRGGKRSGGWRWVSRMVLAACQPMGRGGPFCHPLEETMAFVGLPGPVIFELFGRFRVFHTEHRTM